VRLARCQDFKIMFVEKENTVGVSAAGNFDRQFIFDIEVTRETFPA
jgi:hypothetical protein